MVLGRTRQLNHSQIDALIRYPGFQLEAVDTGYLRETETLGRSRIRARLILHRPNPAIAKTRNLSQYGANSEALSTPTEPSMAQKDAVMPRDTLSDTPVDLRVREHFDRLAAEDNRRDTATPVRRHYNQIAPSRRGGIDDCLIDVIVLDVKRLAGDTG